MEVVNKLDIDIDALLKLPAANQDANEQLEQLLQQQNILEARLEKFSMEPARRPSAEHKAAKSELRAVVKEIKKTKRAIKKCNALKEAASKMGTKHGKVTLNNTRYYW